jgi:capsular polysaccharide biosynthesis protein
LLRHLLRYLASLAAFGFLVLRLRVRALAGSMPRERVLALGDEHLERGEAWKALKLYNLAGGGVPVRLYRAGVMDKARWSKGEAYVHTLRDVMLDADRCAIFDEGKVYVAETSMRNLGNHDGFLVRATTDLTRFAVALPPPRAAIGHPVALIGTDGRNYAHWIILNVLKLAVLERAGLLHGELPLLLNDPLHPWQAEMLDTLGLPAARRILVRPEGVLACRELVVPVAIGNRPQMGFGIEWLRRRYREVIGAAPRGAKRLYVSRRAANRNLVNGAELEARLQALGFQTVELVGKSVAEQAACFAAAELIVSPHEAGLANLVFASPGCRVVEITNTHMIRMEMFKNVADAIGLRMERVVSDRFADDATPLPYRDFYVDVAAVERAVHAG